MRKMEEQGILAPETLKVHKGRDLLRIEGIRKVAKKKEKEEYGEVMLTVHFKIKYEKIGAKGFHPIHLEGFYSKRMPRSFMYSDVLEMMNWVHERLSEFGALASYLEFNKQDYEEGIEIEELNRTRKHDGEFHYDYRRK